MNNRTWEIKELSQEEIRKHIVDYKYDGQPQEVRYCGQTYFTEQTIYLDKNLHPEEKMHTLIHELAHCYIGSFITNQDDKSYSEEDVVDIVSNSYFVILEIVIKYLMKNGEKRPLKKSKVFIMNLRCRNINRNINSIR